MVFMSHLQEWARAFGAWISASDVAGPVPVAPSSNGPDLARGNVVSAEAGVHLGHDAEAQVTVETEAGLATVKNRIPTCCGRYTYAPIGRCCWCTIAICTEAHLSLCMKSGCGIGLCPRCSYRVSPNPSISEVFFILCPKHAEVVRWTGDIEAD